MSEPTDINDPAPYVLSFQQAGRDIAKPTNDSTSVEFSHDWPRRVAESEAVDPEIEDGDSVDSVAALPAALAIHGKRVALVGRFGSMTRREAANVLQSYQAIVVDAPRRSAADPASTSIIDWVVIGADQPPLAQSELLPPEWIDAAARGELEIMHETELWQCLGLVEMEQSSSRTYTPVMLADLLGVSVRVIRRWHRLGLITPATTLHKLPYFDYAEVATAKRLAGWISAGASPASIERRLVDLVQVLPNIRRPLDQLSILIEGKQILLRQGDGLVEPGGQLRFDFDALDEDANDPGSRDVLAFEPPDQPPMLRGSGFTDADPLLIAAYQAEDEDDLDTAIDLYHTILARDGARADVSFQIAELLYRRNFLVAARERYYTAIELDPEFVEARASLGAVLAELGQNELAIAALRGALVLYDDYADVHYTLAKTLDKVGDESSALQHWKRILELAPTSPWASEAILRVQTHDEEMNSQDD